MMQTAAVGLPVGGLPMGGNTVPIEDSPGSPARLTEVLPIQLQGVIDDMTWRSFASEVNAQLAKEHEQIQKTAKRVGPLQCLGCLCFMGPFLISQLSFIIGLDPSLMLMIMPLAFGGFFLMCCSSMCLARAAQAA